MFSLGRFLERFHPQKHHPLPLVFPESPAASVSAAAFGKRLVQGEFLVLFR